MFKKLLVLITILVTLTAITPVSQAKGIGDDFSSFVDSMFQSDETGIVSFTDFEGGLQPPTPTGYDPTLTQVQSGREFVVKVVNYALGFLGLFAVIMVIYGGFLYVSSAGESEGPEKGRKTILYAVIGILIIMGSYVIVNTVLKAPGGNPAAQPDPGSSGAKFASAPKFGRNVQATRVYNLALYVVKAYQGYAASLLSLEGVSQNIDKLWTESGFSSRNDATSALNNIESNYSKVADALYVVATRNNEITPLTDMVEYQKLHVRSWIQDRKDEISRVANTEVNLGTFKDGYDGDEAAIKNKEGEQIAINCSEDSPLTQPSADVCIRGRFRNQYHAFFNTKYNQLLADLTNGQATVNGVKIDIGLTGIKAQLDKDFDAQMDYTQKEIASIEKSAQAWPETATSHFKKLSENIFAKLKTQKKNPVETKANLKEISTILISLYENLKDLEGVNVKMTANVRQGSAPLIVTFSSVGSVDPTNKSINDDQIWWDLDGDGEFGKNSIDCPETKTATITCIYKKPGTYRVALRVSSQSNDVVEGIEYMDIKVNPPRTRFAVQLITTQNNTKQVIPITDYDKDGLIKIDRSRVQLAYSDIAKGLKFSAIGTVSGDIIDKSTQSADAISKKTQETIQRIRWVFGDGTSVDDSPSENPSIMQVDHVYALRGTYQVMLEVTGKDGAVDRKIFHVTVADISAIIYVTPGFTNKVNSQVTFNSAVTSDNSRVTSYEWSSTPDTSKLNSKDPGFSAAIQKPGKYTVTLKVKNESNSEASDKVDVDIESNTPVAKFTVKQPKASQPAVVELNGSESYDPDGPNPDILYSWKVEGEYGKDYTFLQGSESSKVAIVKFLTVGERAIELSVEDKNEKGKISKISQAVKIPTLLDVDWTPTAQFSTVVGIDGKAALNFGIISSNGVSYSVEFGDGEVEDGVFAGITSANVKHTYNKAGIFTVNVTVQDDLNNKVKLTKKVTIGAGNAPIATSTVFRGSEEVNTAEIIVANRKDIMTFDASASKNSSGSSKDLEYSWDFGDGKKSTKPVVKYSYGNVSPKTPGYYLVTLRVSEKEDPSKKSEETFKISVVPQKPQLKTITVIPLAAEYKTPLKVQLKAVEARAPEGQITSYRWWYYDVQDNTNELGSQITTTPETVITLGTKGDEGQEITYAFELELRDTENQTTKSSEVLGEENLPTLKVINGPNKPPKATFTVSKTTVLAGDAVTFTSTSTDADGKIVSYIWDLDGDGFQNDEKVQKSVVTKTYNTPTPTGVKVRLKVVDDSFTEAVSEQTLVIVNSKYAAPKANFTYQQKPGTLEVVFSNTSTVDPALSLATSAWDFDTTSATKESDPNSSQKSPTFVFSKAGVYYTKLTVKDSSEAQASATLPVTVKSLSTTQPGAAPAFSFPGQTGTATAAPLAAKMNTTPAADPMDGKIHLTGNAGNVTIDFSASEGAITKYVIDKNIYFDSNNDGIKDNDENYKAISPSQWTTDFQKAFGKTVIKLTVYDASGKTSIVTREVIFDAPLASGANNVFVIPGAYELYGSLASMFGFGILTYRNRKRRKENE